jgi:hypothetical protein
MSAATMMPPASASPKRSAHRPWTAAVTARAGNTSATIVPIVATSYETITASVLPHPSGAAANSSGITATQGSALKTRNSIQAVIRRGSS